jgi:eukaryotic-like serine/threonine-protein kinase
VSLTPGTRLGPYEVLGPLGAGGMGEVYRARDTRLERTVAVKILSALAAADPEFKARFEREAKAISQLNHPNICVLYDVGESAGASFLVMELLEGETLAARLQKGALPTEDVLRIAGEIADALDKAHRKGIIHRDLKPANVMLTPTGSKLLDFGLAKAGVISTSTIETQLARSSQLSPPAGASQMPTLTARGTILGTFQYMAPEQWRVTSPMRAPTSGRSAACCTKW